MSLPETLQTRDGRTACRLAPKRQKTGWVPYIIHGKTDRAQDLIVYYWPTGAAACPPDSSLDEIHYCRRTSTESDELNKRRSAGGFFL